jgi:Alginate lyase
MTRLPHLVCVLVVLLLPGGLGGQDTSVRASSQVNTPAANAGAVAPDLLLLNGRYLQSVRASISRREPRFTPALDALIEDAERALDVKPMSVMDKAVTPPSGDKHDYMSQAPYWWPDPSRHDGKPYIRRDGERNPEIARISDHDNLGRLVNTVSTLALAFYLTGREPYAAHASLLVRTWFLLAETRMNPHLRYGQGIPGITEGRGIGMIETRGLPELLDGVTLLSASRSWTRSDHAQLETWMEAYLTWAIESTHGQEEARNGNNHETWYDVQVASLALFTGNRDLAKRVLSGSLQRVARHVEKDGRQPRELERTRAWDYSIFNLTAFFHLARLGDRVGVDLWHFVTPDGRSLRTALDYLIPFARGDRPWPYQQMTPFRPEAMFWLLRRAAKAWGEPHYESLARQLGGANDRSALTIE